MTNELIREGLPLAKGDAPNVVRHSPKALSLIEAAARLNASTKTVRRWIHQGLLRKCSVTRKILIPVEDVEKFFEKNSQLEWQN